MKARLDDLQNSDAERMWIDEAQRRYDAYLKGELEARQGDAVMHAAQEALKRMKDCSKRKEQFLATARTGKGRSVRP